MTPTGGQSQAIALLIAIYLLTQASMSCRLKALREEAQAQEPAAQNGHSAEPPQASAPQATAQEKPERKHKRPRGATEESAPVLKFRNYAVRDDKIEHTVLEPAKPPEFKPQEVAAVFDSKPEVHLDNSDGYYICTLCEFDTRVRVLRYNTLSRRTQTSVDDRKIVHRKFRLRFF